MKSIHVEITLASLQCGRQQKRIVLLNRPNALDLCPTYGWTLGLNVEERKR